MLCALWMSSHVGISSKNKQQHDDVYMEEVGAFDTASLWNFMPRAQQEIKQCIKQDSFLSFHLFFFLVAHSLKISHTRLAELTLKCFQLVLVFHNSPP